MGVAGKEEVWSVNEWEETLIDNLLNFAGTPKVGGVSGREGVNVCNYDILVLRGSCSCISPD